METIDTYIVRIYRRDESDREKTTGLVEIVGTDKKEPFRSREELWKILGHEQVRTNRNSMKDHKAQKRRTKP